MEFGDLTSTPRKCKVEMAILELKTDYNGSESVNQHILSIKQEGAPKEQYLSFPLHLKLLPPGSRPVLPFCSVGGAASGEY